MHQDNTGSHLSAEQLSLQLYEVQLEMAITTAEARNRYLLKSMGQGRLSYKRQSPLGTFEARRVGKQGREYLWAVFFRPNS